MSPNRRDFLKLMAAIGASTAIPVTTSTASAAEPTVYEEMIAIRDALEHLRDREDVNDYTRDYAEVNLLWMSDPLMELCPHDRSQWELENIDSFRRDRALFACHECRAAATFPHIDGRYAGWH